MKPPRPNKQLQRDQALPLPYLNQLLLNSQLQNNRQLRRPKSRRKVRGIRRKIKRPMKRKLNSRNNSKLPRRHQKMSQLKSQCSKWFSRKLPAVRQMLSHRTSLRTSKINSSMKIKTKSKNLGRGESRWWLRHQTLRLVVLISLLCIVSRSKTNSSGWMRIGCSLWSRISFSPTAPSPKTLMMNTPMKNSKSSNYFRIKWRLTLLRSTSKREQVLLVESSKTSTLRMPQLMLMTLI